jgi:pSer/pThr/pTyr-binding forkhead associated (FHA) protein
MRCAARLVLDFRRMTALKLRFPGSSTDDLPLDAGELGIGLRADGAGLGPVSTEAACVRVCVDRRGVWLTVGEDAGGVHVNGRRIQRVAMLRTGDAIFVAGHELRLLPEQPPAPPSAEDVPQGDAADPDPRMVLRGLGGRYHGRCFTLDRARLIGRQSDADIRIDDPGFADRHARLERVGDRVRLIDLGSAEGSVVNGQTVRDALLQPGDQVVFDAHHRFVVEAPARGGMITFGHGPADEFDDGPDPFDVPATGRLRLPWLLLAAVLLAAALGALFLFGAS